MNQYSHPKYPSHFLALAIGLITSLILLINVSFKIIELQGLVFAVDSILCPVIACIYLFALRNTDFKEQRHLLNISLISLYLFSIGIYILVNLPASEYMHNNTVYQIVFEDIPKKFFATTISFALSFYVPHLLIYQSHKAPLPVKQCILLAILGGLSFFVMDFFLLFYGPHIHSFSMIFIDSLMMASLILLILGVSYLSFFLNEEGESTRKILPESPREFPLYQYLVSFAVVIMLICLSCEYRIITFYYDYKESILTASGLFFPVTIMISTLVGETMGYRANFKLTMLLIAAQLIFDSTLMVLIALPSPPFFNLNPYYNYIMPRRLPASTLSIFITFLTNGFLLYYLNSSRLQLNRGLRILIANVCANTFLCLIDYTVLFCGLYTSEQIINLAINVWEYKLLVTLSSLPLLLWLCKTMKQTPAFSLVE